MQSPELREYNWTVSPTMLLAPPCLYSVLALCGHFAMVHYKTPSWVAASMRLYNLVQILLCAYMTIGLLPVIGGDSNSPLNPFGLSSKYTSSGEWFVLVHYWSKLLDWLDTLWMVLKKKSSVQMSFLHLFHHATISVVWGYLLSIGHGNGTARYGALINSFTHVLMYSHYLWTSYGWSNPYKNMLTKWQIAQFYSCLVHAVMVVALPHLETEFPINLAWLQLGYHMCMVYLFTFKLRWVPRFIKDVRP